jgi:hypothetical protein
MATMIPSDIEEFGTEGEKAFFKFLQSVAKPDSHYICWYLPDISGNEPDFILYCDDVGLVIFEVKDWALAQRFMPKISIIEGGVMSVVGTMRVSKFDPAEVLRYE